MKRQLPLLLAAVGVGLRLTQLAIGFEPETGLPVPGSLINILLPLFFAAVLLSLVLLSLRRRETGLSFDRCFRPLEGVALPLLITAAFLLMAGGGLYLATYLQMRAGLGLLALGALALFAGAGLLCVIRCWRQTGTVQGILLLPSVLFYLFLLLTAYIAHGTFPVTARYGLEILAVAALLYGFYQIAAAGYCQGSRAALFRGLRFAVVLTPAAADLLSPAQTLSLLGGAAAILAFTALSKEAE